MTTSWKIILIVVGILITASGWIVALRRPATPLLLPADAEWHGTPEQGAALIEKKRREDAFRQKYGVDPGFNPPTREQRAAWEKYQKNLSDSSEKWKKDRAAGKPVLP